MAEDDKAVRSELLVGFVEGAQHRELCQDYWRLDSKGGFVHTVTALGKPYNLPPSAVSALVEQECRAFFSDECCTTCGKPHLIRNRAGYSTAKSLRHWPRACHSCQETQRLEAQRAVEAKRIEQQKIAEEERLLRVASVQEELAVRRRAFLGWVPPGRLSFEDAVFLLSVFRAGGSEDLSFVAPQSDFALPLSPTTTFDRRILVQLYERQILAIHPGSATNSIFSGDAGPFTSFAPFKVHWLLPTSLEGPSSARYLEDLEALLKDPDGWSNDWHEDAAELHRSIAFEECLEYLRLSLEEHGFDLEPGEKLSLVLRSVLRHFSIGQTFNFIWRAARDAAAFYVRERTSKTHARNIVPGSIQRMAERALAEAWVVKAYRRDRRAPESQVSHVLFTMALRLPEGGFHAVPPPPLDQEPGPSDSEDPKT